MKKLLPFLILILFSTNISAQNTGESEKKLLIKKKINLSEPEPGILADLSEGKIQINVEIIEEDGNNVAVITIISESEDGVEEKVVKKQIANLDSFDHIDLTNILKDQIDMDLLNKITDNIDLPFDNAHELKILIEDVEDDDDEEEDDEEDDDMMKKVIIIDDGNIKTFEFENDDNFIEWNSLDNYNFSKNCKGEKKLMFLSDEDEPFFIQDCHPGMTYVNACTTGRKCVPQSECCSIHRSGEWGFDISIFDFNFEKLNAFLESANFSPVATDGALMFGAYGSGYIGNGWYVGGLGKGMTQEQRIDITDGSRYMRFTSGFGGATLAKRMILDRSFSLEGQLMLGGGATLVEITESRGNPSFDDFQSNLDNLDSFQIEQSFLAIQPTISLRYNINNWLSMKGSVNYLATYEFDWKNIPSNNVIEGDAPDNTNGLSYSASLSFGF